MVTEWRASAFGAGGMVPILCLVSYYIQNRIFFLPCICPNLLPLLGVTMDSQQFVMVSKWMENGNINEFVKTHKDARLELVRFQSCRSPRTSPTNFTPSSKTSLAG